MSERGFDTTTGGRDEDRVLSFRCPFCQGREATQPIRSHRDFLSHLQSFHREEIGLEEAEGMGQAVARVLILQFLRSRGVELAAETSRGRRSTPDSPPPASRLPALQGLEEEASESDSSSSSQTSSKEDKLSQMTRLREAISVFINQEPLSFVTRSGEHIEKRNNRFRLLNKAFSVRLNRLGRACVTYGLGLAIIESLLINAVKRIKAETETPDADPFYVSFAISAPEELSRPIVSPYLPAAEKSVNALLGETTLVLTSKSSLFLDRKLEISVRCLGVSVQDESFEEVLFGKLEPNQLARCAKRKGFFGFLPSIAFEADCLLGCIALFLLRRSLGAKRFATSEAARHPESSRRLKSSVRELARFFPAINFNKKQNRDHCYEIDAWLQKHFAVQLCIYLSEDRQELFYKDSGVSLPIEQQLCCLLLNGHICWISDPVAFFRLNGFCEGCIAQAKPKCPHSLCSGAQRGKGHCGICGGSGDCRPRNKMIAYPAKFCEVCRILYPTEACFNNAHTRLDGDGTTLCERVIVCDKCGTRTQRQSASSAEAIEHGCLERRCAAS